MNLLVVGQWSTRARRPRRDCMWSRLALEEITTRGVLHAHTRVDGRTESRRGGPSYAPLGRSRLLSAQSPEPSYSCDHGSSKSGVLDAIKRPAKRQAPRSAWPRRRPHQLGTLFVANCRWMLAWLARLDAWLVLVVASARFKRQGLLHVGTPLQAALALACNPEPRRRPLRFCMQRK